MFLNAYWCNYKLKTYMDILLLVHVTIGHLGVTIDERVHY